MPLPTMNDELTAYLTVLEGRCDCWRVWVLESSNERTPTVCHSSSLMGYVNNL
jgi:hypothetical protein